MTTTPTTPKGTRNISFNTIAGLNGLPIHTISYWAGKNLFFAHVMEDQFGKMTEVVHTNSKGQKLPAEPFQAEAIQWFHETIAYYNRD